MTDQPQPDKGKKEFPKPAGPRLPPEPVKTESVEPEPDETDMATPVAEKEERADTAREVAPITWDYNESQFDFSPNIRDADEPDLPKGRRSQTSSTKSKTPSG